MAQVIIVSNRLPISIKKEKGQLIFSPSLGGIATGLSSYVSNRHNSLWIGWPGIASDDLSSVDKENITQVLGNQGYIPVFLSKKQVENFYNGYSNSVLWPLFHDLPGKKFNEEQVKEWWNSYQAVNSRFAETVLHTAEDKSQIWVHDYQLLLLPEILKSEHKDINVGLFLHIPFPSPKRFAKLDTSRKILSGMLSSDLIGFHTSSFVENFSKSIALAGLGEVINSQIIMNNHVARISEFPMGIDYEKYAEASKLATVRLAVKEYKRKYKKLKVIVSIDRLDPTKGLVERLRAYDRFLEQYPKQRKKVVLVMVAAPSRTDIKAYQDLSKKLVTIAAQINENYGEDGWLPVDYINEPLPFENVSALFQIADVAFIAPLRDGMNLAAKEFVATNKRHGVLILSETAGAAEELSDALIVDHSHPETLTNALNQAINMRKRELRNRLKRMRKKISTNTVQSWAKTFVDTLQQPIPKTPRLTRTLTQRLRTRMLKEYRNANKRLLLLDYDGSLVPFSENYEKAEPPESLLNLIRNLAEDKKNDIVLISGRSGKDLEAWFGSLPISLVAEHGAAIKNVGHKWNTTEKSDTEWKHLLLPSLEKYSALTPGSRVEVKPHSLVWHYRAASPYHAQKYAVIIKRALKPILRREDLELLQGNKVLEIKNPHVNKGAAAMLWLNKPHDFVIAIGDDVTDEELFSILPLSSHSIKVGRGITQAQYRVGSYKGVISLLKRMSS